MNLYIAMHVTIAGEWRQSLDICSAFAGSGRDFYRVISAMIMLKVDCLLLKRAHRVLIYYIDRALSLLGITPYKV